MYEKVDKIGDEEITRQQSPKPHLFERLNNSKRNSWDRKRARKRGPIFFISKEVSESKQVHERIHAIGKDNPQIRIVLLCNFFYCQKFQPIRYLTNYSFEINGFGLWMAGFSTTIPNQFYNKSRISTDDDR